MTKGNHLNNIMFERNYISRTF